MVEYEQIRKEEIAHGHVEISNQTILVGRTNLGSIIENEIATCSHSLVNLILENHGTSWKAETEEYYEKVNDILKNKPFPSPEEKLFVSPDIDKEADDILQKLNALHNVVVDPNLPPGTSYLSQNLSLKTPMFDLGDSEGIKREQLKQSFRSRKKKAKWK